MQTIQLKNLKLPKLLAELTHSNQFLKMFSITALALLVLSMIVIYALGTKTPVVLTFNAKAIPIEESALPNPQIEIESAIRHYLELRYQWNPENVKTKLSDAQVMIQPNALKSYLGAIANVVKFSTEKQVSQRVYASAISIDLEKRLATIQGDRITAIQGLKAAGDLKLELAFDYGTRTRVNPWGIYIVKEREN